MLINEWLSLIDSLLFTPSIRFCEWFIVCRSPRNNAGIVNQFWCSWQLFSLLMGSLLSSSFGREKKKSNEPLAFALLISFVIERAWKYFSLETQEERQRRRERKREKILYTLRDNIPLIIRDELHQDEFSFSFSQQLMTKRKVILFVFFSKKFTLTDKYTNIPNK